MATFFISNTKFYIKNEQWFNNSDNEKNMICYIANFGLF